MSTKCHSCGAMRPSRLTASPAGTTVWVQEPHIDAKPPEHVVLLRGKPHFNRDAVSPNGWTKLTRREWFEVRDTIDKYLAALANEDVAP